MTFSRVKFVTSIWGISKGSRLEEAGDGNISKSESV